MTTPNLRARVTPETLADLHGWLLAGLPWSVHAAVGKALEDSAALLEERCIGDALLHVVEVLGLEVAEWRRRDNPASRYVGATA